MCLVEMVRKPEHQSSLYIVVLQSLSLKIFVPYGLLDRTPKQE